MLSKNEVKDIQSLSQKKFRDQLKLFIAEGPKTVSELVELIPDQIEKVYAVKEWMITIKPKTELKEIMEVSGAELDKLSQLQTPNQVIAVVRQSTPKRPDGSLFTLYLDTIQDPGNFGTIVRIADWFGIKNIVCSIGCVDLYNPKVVQSTMASIARVNVFYDEHGEWLKGQTVPVWAATLDGTVVYDHSKNKQGILIIGNESKGIRPEILQYANEKITIPKKGSAESLNAAVATGIILSHLLE
jgi:RNA methyltransferase, TrmH family